jgi:predicted RND superfamily exporter protein
VEGTKEALADKLDKLEKEVQEHRRTINLFIESDAYRDHEIVEAYVQIWKKIDAKPDRNRWLEALTEIHTRIRAMIRGKKPEETSRYYRSFIQEVPPKGSKFIKDGGYITPDEKYITPLLKIEFRSLQRSYDARNPRNNSSKKIDPEDYQFMGRPSKN